MNTKSITNYLIIGLAIPLMSGCFTAKTASDISQTETESFYPKTLFKSKTDGGVALEGDWTNHRHNNFHGFLIIPEKTLVSAHRNTGGDVTFADLCALPSDARKQLRVKRSLPSGFEKVYDFPKNQTDIDLNTTSKIHVGSIGALPFTLIINAATLPVQVPLILYLSQEFKGVD